MKKKYGEAATKLYKILQKKILESITIFKPVPAPISKIKNKYRWRIIIKCKLSNNVIKMVNNTLEEFYKNNNKDIRIIVDTNPNNMN